MTPLLSYKTSAFYYRQSIHAARRKEEVQVVALGLITEFERLRHWISEVGLVPPDWLVSEDVMLVDPSAFIYRHRVRRARSKAAAVEIALQLVTEYEELREWVRAHDMIPPKWSVSPCELFAKRILPQGDPAASPSSPTGLPSGKAE